MLESEKEIIKDTLKRFIFCIRKEQGVSLLVFAYYSESINDNSSRPNCRNLNTVKNFFWTKKQIKGKILTARNNYWNLNETNIKFVENFVINHEKEFEKLFKEEIEFLWNCDFEEELRILEKEEKEEENKQKEIYKNILKERFDFYGEIVELILKDKITYPYKSDKIKAFLEIELDVETIYLLMNTQEKLNVQRGYVDKYYKEREEGIKNKKIVRYELNSVMKKIKREISSI